ncbi:MAG: hypothetical protein WBB47_13630 [Paenisporosarcina sp.]
MKLFFSLTILFLAISLLLFQSNSFTKAEITSKARFSVVSEENGLVAISYAVGKQFIVTNNTGKTIEIVDIKLIGDSNNRIIEIKEKGTFLQDGGINKFNITADPKKLKGKVIQLKVRWKGGSAVINSNIPESFIKQMEMEVEDENKNEKKVEQAKEKDKEKGKEKAKEQEKEVKQSKQKLDQERVNAEVEEEPVIPEVVEESVTPEVEEEPVIPEVVEESVTPEVEEEPVIPEVVEESVTPEVEEEPVESEVVGEQSNPEDEDK